MNTRHPSPAMCVALLALLVSLGGNAVAAGVIIKNSNQIAPNAVNSGDVKDKSLKVG